MVLCICYYKCRRRTEDEGRVVAVSLRNRHRKRDILAYDTRAYDGLAPPPLLLYARQHNHHKSFRVRLPAAVGASPHSNNLVSQQDVGESNSAADTGSCGGMRPADPEESDGQPSPGVEVIDGVREDAANVGDEARVEADECGLGGEDGTLDAGYIGVSGVSVDTGNEEARAAGVGVGAIALDPDVGDVGGVVRVDDNLDSSEDPDSQRFISFLELAGAAEASSGISGMDSSSFARPLDNELDEDVGGTDDGLREDGPVGGDTGVHVTGDCTYGVVAAVHSPPMGPLTEISHRARERLLERIRVEEREAELLAPTLAPLGKDHLLSVLLPPDPYAYVPDVDSPAPPLVDQSKSAVATMDLLAAWQSTGGTRENYAKVGAVLQKHAETAILSLHSAQRLVEESSGLAPVVYDMCPSSCVAFTGPRQDLDHCPECGLARYRAAGSHQDHVAVKTYNYIPYLPRLQAYFGNVAWSRVMRYWHQRGTAASQAFTCQDGSVASCDPEHRFGDLCDGLKHSLHRQEGRFVDAREVAVAISTDGAQLLRDRRASSAWLVLVQTLNLPPSLRFAVDHQHVSLIVPGPGSPKDLDSFLWPLYSELASLGTRGTMVWDALDLEWFRLRVHLIGVFGDQPASAKVSHFVGGCGLYGCRYCTIRAVRNDGAGHSVYFPLHPKLLHSPLNRGRLEYNPEALPLRTVTQYRLAVARVVTAKSVERRRAVGTSTGITELPPISFAPSFDPLDFFPLDPFHLFNFNVPKTVWKALIDPLPGEFGFTAEERTQFGAFIGSNAKAYPAAFSSRAPRDISLFSNTSYKMVEWGSVFHHFLPAYLHHIDAPSDIRTMLDNFLQGVDLTMDRRGVTLAQIHLIGDMFVQFTTEWERLYVGSDAAIARSTISVHLLLHVVDQLVNLGSVRATSQATCERMIGLLKKGVTAFRYPYSVMSNRALSRAQVTLSRVRSGSTPESSANAAPLLSMPIHSAHSPLLPFHRSMELGLLRDAAQGQSARFRNYGRLAVGTDLVIRGARIEGSDSRCCANVEAVVGGDAQFFHVLHFSLITTSTSRTPFALVQRFVVATKCPMFVVGSWSLSVELIKTTSIIGVVAALTLGSSIYVVRRSAWQQDPIFGSDDEEADSDVLASANLS
ncbi:hypothetical protein A4X13_0g4740 [Tilletia indica]|uniref:Transposase family Tnp2 protein n=1 Tax=Tilletia indica TaxID=43049 RepID=A0A8T8SW58_9BASI|nr:hypothetical protein A4X13_0g4740 [Tilletia indica]